ncbi:hypothetical protein NL529_34860, partial [Klebsiella pneumoniae]|nr:hypothetical protein [Klebsiella pneumoniae]
AAVRSARPTEGYRGAPAAIGAERGRLFVGARGPRLNRLASRLADGVFLGGIPPFRYPEVVGWTRSARNIDLAMYP